MIKQKIDLIAECVFTKIQKTAEEKKSFGLYSGEFGLLLFLLYYSRYSNNNQHTLLAEEYAEKLLEQFVKEVKLHTFCNGISGILYLLEFLRGHDFIDMDVSDIQPLLDNHIVYRMRRDIQQSHYDFMHGALGVGLYFLKKGIHTEYIQELIEFLYTTAEKDTDNQMFKWETAALVNEKNCAEYNLSLSHGISSIIIFLSRVIKNGISSKKNIEMLSGAVNYVLSQEKDFSQFGSYFPSHILKNAEQPVSKSRLAWCYGDLGIGIALWQAGQAIDKTEWQDKGLKILLQSSQRRSSSETHVQDAGICHGSAGVALIYRRMFLETHCDEFKAATLHWLNQTLKFSRFEDGLAGYKTLMKDGWICNYSLLGGISGIGLVLLSYIEDNQQDWDEMFLLS